MSELFEKRNLNYDLCSQTDFSLHSVNAVAYGLKSLKYYAGKVQHIVPFETRNAVYLEESSTKIKSWKPDKCHCRLCLAYTHQVGNIQRLENRVISCVFDQRTNACSKFVVGCQSEF